MDKMVNYFEIKLDISTLEKVKLKYSIEVLLNDISKLIILLFIFSILGEFKTYIYSILAHILIV